MQIKQKISPCLWFNNNAEEAVKLYLSIFKDSKLGKTLRYDKASAKQSGQKEGSVLTMEFKIAGQNFTALNGGPMFKFTEAISFMIECKDQKEIDYYWEKLTANGGEESYCGWLKDKFGVSWQVFPSILPKFLADKDPVKSARTMQAMMKMRKIILKDIQNAYNNK